MTEAIRESVNNIDSILVEMSADHPGDIIADIPVSYTHLTLPTSDLV